MTDAPPLRRISTPPEKMPRRKCGHPRFPTLDIILPTRMTGYCLYCVIDKLGLKPVMIAEVDKPEDWQDKTKIRILLDE